jgi:signal transduction histidine kinase/CheY-like chemotaxis protein
MDSPPALASAFRLFARSSGLVVAALGALVLAGWATGVDSLTRLFPGFISMRPNTALTLMACGLGAALAAPAGAGTTARSASRALGALAVALAAWTLAEHLTGRAPSIDQILIAVPRAPGELHPGRMPLLATLATLLLGMSLTTLDLAQPSGFRPAPLLALVAGLVPLQALVSFAYGLAPQYAGSPFAQTAPQTAAGLALLTAAVLAARPEHPPARLLASAGPGGTLTRRLLIPVVLIPVLLGYVFVVAGPRLGQYEALVGASLLVVSAVVTGSLVVWRNAREVQRSDDERARVEDTLRAEREWLRRVEAERMSLLEREQAARAEAERASRAKDEFIATLSHELRTPLNSVLGWARLLRTGKLDAAGVGQAVEAIERGATTQAQIVDDLLDVSRIVRGALRLDVRPVDLAPVIAAAVDTVRPAARAKETEIAVFHGAPGPVAGDPGRLQQVIWNLLANAIKFTPPGGRVEVRTRAVESGVEISVSDNGNGIPREFLPHLFERFRQADSSTTRAHGGLGLGLAIVRHLVEAHGGTVGADSAGPGLGSTFTVRLPLAAPRPRTRTGETMAVVAQPLQAAAGPGPSLASLRVLVVDDDPDTREAVRRLLEQAGAQVSSASTAAEALEALQRAPPDVLLSDIAMPGRDGYDLIRQVRALAPEQGGRVPAAALTAFTQVEHRREALVAGYQIWLPKPVEPTALTEAVARLAGRA